MTRKILVDTDIYIDFFKKKPWARAIFSLPAHKIFYTTITVKELLNGAKSGADEERILRFLHFHTELRITSEVAEKSFSLMQKHPRLSRNDALIASCALVKRLPLITRNIKDFSFIEDLQVIDGKDF